MSADKDETSWSLKQMKASIDVAMGGRAAEEVIFGRDNVTSGASSDFEQATRIAFDMVDKFGMSDKSGYVAFSSSANRSGVSSVHETRALDLAPFRDSRTLQQLSSRG